MAEAIVDLLEVIEIQHDEAGELLALHPVVVVLEEEVPVVEAGELIRLAESLEPLLQLVLAGDAAGHPGHRPLALVEGRQRRYLALEALHPLGTRFGIDAVHLGRGELVLHHLHLTAGEGLRHLFHHPQSLLLGQHVQQPLADKRVAVLVGLLLHTADVFDVVAILAEDEDRVRQLGHHFIELYY